MLFDGQLVKVGKFSHSLRKHIFMYEIVMYISVTYIFDTALPGREYLGLLDTPGGDKVVEDPIIESFYKVAS